jgi:hypothetical protein
MVRRVYSHLGTVRHRSEAVEYRVEHHFEQLGERLQRLGVVSSIGTTGQRTAANETAPAQLSEHGDDGSDEWARRDSNARPLAPEASALSN